MTNGGQIVLQSLTPMLRTWDLPGTIRFWTETLGFECESRDEESGWAALRRDDVRVMISAPNDHLDEQAAGFTGSLYIRTDAVDQLWASLENRARICYPLEDFPYGMREFAVFDNNGYLLQFGQER